LWTAAPEAAAAPPKVKTIYHKSRSFRIPFNVDPADRARLREVQLWVSSDLGFHWEIKSRTTPDHPYFTFRADRDAEYWFAVRTLDTKGQLYPPEDERAEPSMKVIVDTNPPSLVLDADPAGRRGSLAAVRWEVRDENLDLSKLVVEYQAEGAHEWRQVPIRRRTQLGRERWDAGTADPLRVRASVADRAGNVTEEIISLSEGTPSHPGLATNGPDDFPPPAPIAPISDVAGAVPADALPREPSRQDPFPAPSPAPERSSPPPQAGFDANPFAGSESPVNPAAPAGVPPQNRGKTLLVPSPQFALQYAVEDAGPNGPATVELWVLDRGNWYRFGEDADRVSPFQVNLTTEGKFGLSLVARSATGLGDQPPAPGDPPQMWVVVDSTPPVVQLDPPQVGTGPYAGKVAIRWLATDEHFGPRPVSLSWRSADQPDAAWQPIATQVENSGRFIWTVPPNIPPRFHIRIEVVDSIGNHSSAETTEMGAVIVDRSRPHSRITGLEPTTRTGAGPAAQPLR
jgi:hypothetical protein